LKWDKNKGTKGYLWLIIDDAGVIGVLRRDVRHWFVWVFILVPIDGGLDGCLDECLDGGLDGGGGRCAGG
jgi:hypothetical protein